LIGGNPLRRPCVPQGCIKLWVLGQPDSCGFTI
jgi:hypothetical protein